MQAVGFTPRPESIEGALLLEPVPLIEQVAFAKDMLETAKCAFAPEHIAYVGPIIRYGFPHKFKYHILP